MPEMEFWPHSDPRGFSRVPLSTDNEVLLAPIENARMLAALKSYVIWPAQMHRRKQYMATVGATAIAKAESIFDNLKLDYGAETEEWASFVEDAIELGKNDLLEHLRAELFSPFGGYGTVAAAPGYEGFQREIKKGVEASAHLGRIIHFLLAMLQHHESVLSVKGGPSLEKSILLLDWIHSTYGGPRKSTIRTLASKYRGAAALYGALTVISDNLESNGLSFDTVFTHHPVVLLSYTREIEKILSSFRARNDGGTEKRTLKNLWVPPLNIELPEPNVLSRVYPLSKDLLDFLNSENTSRVIRVHP